MSEKSADIMHMNKRFARAYLKALSAAIAGPTSVAKEMGIAYRTLRSHQEGSRSVSLKAARALSKYLRRQASTLLKEADALDSIITREEQRDASQRKTK